MELFYLRFAVRGLTFSDFTRDNLDLFLNIQAISKTIFFRHCLKRIFKQSLVGFGQFHMTGSINWSYFSGDPSAL